MTGMQGDAFLFAKSPEVHVLYGELNYSLHTYIHTYMHACIILFYENNTQTAYFIKVHVVLDLKQYPSKLALGVAMFAKGVYNI